MTGLHIFNPTNYSEFDQYGDTEAFGVFPDWQRQLSKFASVQDRLREWKPSVGDKIKHFACLVISMLDIDALRVDKATQVTTDFLAEWGESVHTCARQHGKNNFFISGEVTGGDTFGSIYIGQGRQPNNRPPDLVTALTVNNQSNENYFLRSPDLIALDSVAFHYSMYRALTRFLGMDGNLEVAYDTPVDFTDMWNTMAVTNDFLNSQTNKVDPRHMFGVSNQDVFRWPSIINGTLRQNLGSFACALVMPGTHTVHTISTFLTIGHVGRGTRIPSFRQHSFQLFVWSSSNVICTSVARPWLLQTQFNSVLQLRYPPRPRSTWMRDRLE